MPRYVRLMVQFRPDRRFRPSLGRGSLTAFRLEGRAVPGTVSFYSDLGQNPGDLQAMAGGTVYPETSGLSNQPTSSSTVQNGSSSASTSDYLSNAVAGTPGFMGSDGQLHGGQIKVSATEGGMSSATYGGPAYNSGSNATGIEFINSLQTTSTVNTDGQGPYTLNGASGEQITGGSSLYTDHAYAYTLHDTSGNSPNNSNTLTISFTMTMDAQQANFFLGSSIVFHSSNFDVSLDVRDAGGDGTHGLGLHVWNPTTNQSYYDNSSFTDGSYGYQVTVPAPAHELISYSSSIASYPLGNFNASTTTQTSNLHWSYTEVVNSQ